VTKEPERPRERYRETPTRAPILAGQYRRSRRSFSIPFARPFRLFRNTGIAILRHSTNWATDSAVGPAKTILSFQHGEHSQPEWQLLAEREVRPCPLCCRFRRLSGLNAELTEST